MGLFSLFNVPKNASRSAIKTLKLKRHIIKILITEGNYTIVDLSNKTYFSVPTVTKVINSLLKDNIVLDLGKIDTSGGRRPNLYGINSKSGFFLGIEVNRKFLTIGLQDLKNEFVKINERIPFELSETHGSLSELCSRINEFVEASGIDRRNIIGACVNLSGRINSVKGYSYNYFYIEEDSLSHTISTQIGINTYLENDTRAMAFGEYNCGVVNGEKNVIFVNMSWGVGIGIITDGQLYYGHSGYSGEFGHSPLFDNNILCQCGKRGCLETEVSGWALERIFKDAIREGNISLAGNADNMESIENIDLERIINAVVMDEDTLAIDIISALGEKMGRYISLLINVFNPELVVIGGIMSTVGDYLMLPILTAIKKYSLNLVSQDMELKLSSLGSHAGVAGACYIVRKKFMEQLD
ncbi:MAG: ROK family transcriptional regulator [Dysgonamonadaceae bacterium]|jgi:predicted NBD/HSP70 family sugar kinase|nr:ROK family transcriptional regulator [Dysgonamonadaceae bacterium]